ncbi:cytochrome P450 [Lentinula aciculospora]|uniref:Cytochrome P450 n=1 Tax=Lentinula aciculospora TaxID=153920 RepID=A0A9W9DY47_9AGAR|nr:cytochrome P450 [Lentinula aciculospora]
MLLWLAAILVLPLVRLLFKDQARKHLPPGPRGWPILGNLSQVAGESQIWHLFDKWKYEYGALTYLNLFGKDFIVINTREAALELLERRSAMYSDRPRFYVLEYIGGEMAMPFAKYTKAWQNMRRATHEVLHNQAAQSYHPVQTEEAIILAHKLLFDSSLTLREKINGSAAIVLSVVYGKRSLSIGSEELPKPTVDNSDSPDSDLLLTSDPLQSLSNIGHRFTSSGYPGSYLVDVFPILDYFPAFMAKWKSDAIRDRIRVGSFFQRYYDDAAQNDKHRSSLCAKLTDTKLASGLTIEEKAWVAGITSVAGLETTSTTLSFFLYAMCLNPEIQHRAHKELDYVIGRSHSPMFADMKNLPYIRAIVKEVLRWNPALPVIVPRKASEDDWYKGHFIPKGAAMMLNLWSMNYDTDVYGPDVKEFRPERFLQQCEKTGEYILKPEFENEDGHSSYGFGRRKCIGRYIADNALFIDMSTILWALNIEAVASDKPVVQKKVLDTINPIPDFQCKLTPRFRGVDSVLQQLRDEVAQAREE